MIKLDEYPENAWLEYIQPHLSNTIWLEDSKHISSEIELNKRELFALIVLAHLYSQNPNSQKKIWKVGYDDSDVEPNDGYIVNNSSKVRFEHKIVPQFSEDEVLNAILSTYQDQAIKGSGYGSNRILIIQPNKAPKHGGMIKISKLTDEIGTDCPFEKVFTLGVVSFDKGIAKIHLIQHFPPRNKGDYFPGKGIAQVDFNLITGGAVIPHCGIDIN